MKRQRLLIADDHTLVRQGLRALLSSTPELEVVGEAGDGREALRLVSTLKPSLIFMDLSMPGTNGTEVIRAIKRRYPETKIIALTFHKTEDYVRATLDAGADAYLLKDDSRNELLAAINSVEKGQTYLSPGVCGKVVNGYLERAAATTSSRSWNTLTHRERQVIKLIAEGYKNKQIAEYLTISVKTVERHRSNLMSKLDLHNGSALTAYAFQNRLVGE